MKVGHLLSLTRRTSESTAVSLVLEMTWIFVRCCSGRWHKGSYFDVLGCLWKGWTKVVHCATEEFKRNSLSWLKKIEKMKKMSTMFYSKIIFSVLKSLSIGQEMWLVTSTVKLKNFTEGSTCNLSSALQYVIFQTSENLFSVLNMGLSREKLCWRTTTRAAVWLYRQLECAALMDGCEEAGRQGCGAWCSCVRRCGAH